jgi:hypothetical protein
MVNLGIRISIIKPYRSTLKYPDYKKDTNAHVKVFNVIVKANG